MSSITVTKRVSLTPDNRHRMQVWVSETTNNIPPTVFVYQKLPSVPLADLSDLFVHMASYADITDFPEDAPAKDSPFFRKRYVDLVFDSLPVLDATYVKMMRMVKLLVEDIGRLNDWGPVEVVEIPAP